MWALMEVAAFQGVPPDWFLDKPIIFWEWALTRYNVHQEVKRHRASQGG